LPCCSGWSVGAALLVLVLDALGDGSVRALIVLLEPRLADV
jgi:hypothetical protein